MNQFDARTDRFVSYRHQPSNPSSLSDDLVLSIHEDKKGILWLGTFGGINDFNRFFAENIVDDQQLPVLVLTLMQSQTTQTILPSTKPSTSWTLLP